MVGFEGFDVIAAGGLCLLSLPSLLKRGPGSPASTGVAKWVDALFVATAALLLAEVISGSIDFALLPIIFSISPAVLFALAIGEELFFRVFASRLLTRNASLLLYALLVPLLFSSSFLAYAATAIFLLGVGAASAFLLEKHGLGAALFSRGIIVLGGVLSLYSPQLPVELFLLSVPLFLSKAENPLKEVGLHFLDGPVAKQVLFGLAIAIACFVLIQLEGFLLALVKLQDSSLVANSLAHQSALALIVVLIISPIAEEVFFRGFLQGKIGVILSSVIFALLHLGYGSVLEVVSALTVSLVLGRVVRQRKDHGIVPTIVAHALLNLAAVTIVFIH